VEKNLEHTFLGKGVQSMALKLILLKRIGKKEIYSYALLKELGTKSSFLKHLRHHGMNVKNDIYNTVKALEKSGYIKTDVRIEGGRLKKYYSITKEGRVALKQTGKILRSSLNNLIEIMR
jgi:DNA-binding PadR family transcriptional regulator